MTKNKFGLTAKRCFWGNILLKKKYPDFTDDMILFNFLAVDMRISATSNITANFLFLAN